jgi:hypothetical protein
LHFLAPQPPTNITSEIYANNSAKLRWVADDSTGIANLFRVQATFEKTIYEPVDGCEPVQRKKLNLEIAEAEALLEDLEPYSIYSVKLESQNNYGISDPSKRFSFRTKTAEPSTPRDFSVEFSDSSSGNLVDGTVTWKEPCHPNGRVEFYSIKLIGSRAGIEDEEQRKNMTGERSITFVGLRRGFNYELHVKARNRETFGKAKKFSFKAPSGSE